ncbi:MAG: hypothetical protein IH851_09835 [Armatimonadetes bacterium]|nr:hypothetical protein [Armatimonadota bacterium]
MMASEPRRPNWKMLLALAAATLGVGAAAVVYVQKMRARAQDVEGLIDDALDFCRDKAAELESLVTDAQAAS